MALDTKPVLADTALFGQLSDRSLEQLTAAAGQYFFRKGRIIYFEDEPAQRLYVLVRGAVKLVVESFSGHRWALGVLVPSATFGMLGTTDGVYVATAETLTDSTVLVLSQENLLQSLSSADRRAVREGLLRAAADQVDRLAQQAADLAYCRQPQRVAKVLLTLAEQAGTPHGEGGVRISLPLTQQDLAELAGSTRVSVNVTLRHLDKRGWIERTGTNDLILLKPEQLEEFGAK
jgi:CRP/FNR family transcriptional regulator, cyclic AMP receptor protein